MAEDNDTEAALSNLKAIKNGDDPRSSVPASQDDALAVAEAEVDRLFNEVDMVGRHVFRDEIHVGVARWTGRNGVCKYDKRLTKKRFGKRMTSLPRKRGHHAIVLNERIFDQGNRDDFIDTVRHELAHAVCCSRYEKYPSREKHHDYDPYYSGHGKAWKNMAQALGADPSSSHHKRDRSSEKQYFIYCTNCGMEGGRTKRSKIIKQPFNRMCGKCEHSPLSSYEKGQSPPTEDGIVKVESLDWDNRDEWIQAGRP